MFYIGQKVACVDAKRFKHANIPGRYTIEPPLIEGNIYVIEKYTNGLCCNIPLVDVGLNSVSNTSRCNICNRAITTGNTWWIAAKRFVPLEDYEAMSELVKELTQPVTVLL